MTENYIFRPFTRQSNFIEYLVKKKQSTKIIACATVIEEMRPFLPHDIECKEMEPALHIHADKLRNALQDIIDEITADSGSIFNAY